MPKAFTLQISLFGLFLSLFLAFPKVALADSWFFPMDKYQERQTVKAFGQLIDDKFYIGEEALFPFNRFYGYHAAVDLEAFPEEKDEKVPVYAIASGTITYIGRLPGYGGVILQKLDGENLTALYGHVKITGLQFKVGDHINLDSTPKLLTYLGEGFSEETSKEREHLHFGIYKGTDRYFRGHEKTLSGIRSKWLDPSQLLKEKGAQSPSITVLPKGSSSEDFKSAETKRGFFYAIFNWIRELFI